MCVSMMSDPTTALFFCSDATDVITEHIFNLLLHMKIPFKSVAKVFRNRNLLHIHVHTPPLLPITCIYSDSLIRFNLFRTLKFRQK